MQFQNGTLLIGGTSVEAVAARFGTPLYLYDGEVILRQLARIRSAFSGLPFRPFYAMKANGNLSILRMMRENGFGCDAVSPGEIFLARQAGFSHDQIWFTCSNVSDDDLRAIPDPRIVVNVNSVSEIDRCLALDLPNPLALRVNPAVGAGAHHDVVTAGGGVKFGIDMAELDDARMIIEDSGREIVGLHAHIGSGIDSPQPLLQAARTLIQLAADFRHLHWVNFGGGIGVPYRPGDAEFPVEDYGRELAGLAGNFLRARDLTAILEPGRFLVAPSGYLVSRVTAKRMSGGMEWLGCDTGFNHLVRPSKYGAYHHIVNATRGSNASLRETFDLTRMQADYVVSGNLCESGDVFTRNEQGDPVPRRMDKTQVGDLIVFCDAGAYGFSMGSHYNARLLPPEVMVSRGEARLIRRRQTYEELVGGME